MIVTDKRTYNIVLHFIGEETKKNADGTVSKSFIETPWAVRQAVLQLTYEYPFEQQEKAKSAADKKRITQKLKQTAFYGHIVHPEDTCITILTCIMRKAYAG